MEKDQHLIAEDSRSPPQSIGWLVLAALHLLNGLAAAIWAVILLLSTNDSTFGESNFVLGSFQAMSAAGMIGVGVCLITHRNRALAWAVIPVVLLLIEAGIGVPLAADKSFGLAGAMVTLHGWVSTGIFAVIPVVTSISLFIAFVAAGRKPSLPIDVP